MRLDNIFKSGQRIIYRKDGKLYSEIPDLSFITMPENLWQYVRHSQPFTSKGDILTIPLYEGPRLLRTLSAVMTTKIKKVRRKENTLIISTQNSTYEIEYRRINLEKVLQDGQFKGVNKSYTWPYE